MRVSAGHFSDFAPSSARLVEAGTHRVCVVRIIDDLYAIGDTCSHADVSLSEGTIWDDECEIECWKHGASFSLRNGEPQSLPATLSVPVYAVHRDGDDVFVEVL